MGNYELKYASYEDHEYESKFGINQYDLLQGFLYKSIIEDVNLDTMFEILVEKCNINPVIAGTCILYLHDYKVKYKFPVGDVSYISKLIGGLSESSLKSPDFLRKKYDRLLSSKFKNLVDNL